MLISEKSQEIAFTYTNLKIINFFKLVEIYQFLMKNVIVVWELAFLSSKLLNLFDKDMHLIREI